MVNAPCIKIQKNSSLGFNFILKQLHGENPQVLQAFVKNYK